MQTEEVKQLIEAGIANSEAMVSEEGGKYSATVVSDVFEGKTLLAKQKLVFATVNQQIQSGAIHALTIKTYTPAQWAEQNS